MFSDHHVPPTRSIEYLVKGADDLDALECLFRDLSDSAADTFYQNAKEAKAFCDKYQLMLSAYSLGVGDPIVWMSGVEQAAMMSMTEKEDFKRYVDIVSKWNLRLTQLAIQAGVDHVVRRGWYESTDFWSPDLYEEFFLAPLKQQTDMLHDAGVTVDYVMASGAMPLLKHFKTAGIDMYSNIDPVSWNTDIKKIRAEIGDSIALCGGLNNYDLLEKGTEDEVRQGVRNAVDVFTPATGCILAPSDSLFLGDPETIERNFYTMIDEWKVCRGRK